MLNLFLRNQGLNRQPLRQIARTIAKLGFNCVRLPFNLEMLFGNATQVPNPKISLRANPELMRFSPLEVFDATIAELSAQGLSGGTRPALLV